MIQIWDFAQPSKIRITKIWHDIFLKFIEV